MNKQDPRINCAQRADWQVLARWLTQIEHSGIDALTNPILAQPPQLAFRFGITGPPGAGKSTLISQLIGQLRSQGQVVGVLAVDPSSPFTHGAILGDRIRYADHSLDDKVFIRSLGTRGSLGGLSASAYLMLRAYDVAGFDVVLIETVGVGQTELEIVSVADHVGVVLVPESGDAIQAMKAGLLEIADMFIVNKSDRPGADSLVKELEASVRLGVELGLARKVTVHKTVAHQGVGAQELATEILKLKKDPAWQKERNTALKLQWEARALLRDKVEREIQKKVGQIQSAADLVNVVRQNI